MGGNGIFARGTSGHGSARLTLRGGPPERSGFAGRLLRLALAAGACLLVGSALFMVGYVEHTYGSHYSAVPERPARVVVADLAANRRARGASPPGLERWRSAAQSLGIELEHRTVESLAGLDSDRYGALILPEQHRMADAEWDRVVALLREGVGVIFTGHPGRQYRNGNPRRAVLLETLFPGARFARLRRSHGAASVSLAGPLVAGFAPGELLELEPRPGALAMRAPGSLRWGAAGVYAPGDAALAHGRLEHGPVAWIAPGASWFVDPERAGELLRNALRWAIHQPVLELRPWPGGVAAAALIGADAEALQQLSAAGLSVTPVPDPARPGGDRELRLARLLAEFEAVEHQGGLYALTDSSAWLAGVDRERLEHELREELLARNVWLAEGDELASWWRGRRAVHAEFEAPGGGRAHLTLRNDGTLPIARATARVYLPPGARPPMHVESGSFLTRHVLQVGTRREWLQVIAPRLEPGEAVRYSFNY